LMTHPGRCATKKATRIVGTHRSRNVIPSRYASQEGANVTNGVDQMPGPYQPERIMIVQAMISPSVDGQFQPYLRSD
jgi:hypothetical protein